MTLRDRLRQLLVATLVVIGLSSAMVLLLLRCERAAELLGAAESGHPSPSADPGANPLDDGCPRRDHATRKDLTIHFFRELPLSQLDGWIEILDATAGRRSPLFRGPYRPTITLHGVCYDDAPAADGLALDLALVTRHHEYSFSVTPRLDLRSSSEVEIMFWVSATEVPMASLTPLR